MAPPTTHAERQKKYRANHSEYKEAERLRSKKIRTEAGDELKQFLRERSRERMKKMRERKKKELQESVNVYQSKSAESRAVNR
jgi:hypothetical protein